ncbi:MAG: hypothetical protein IJF25_01455 [Oscillospiraceae bacterium]|nr:hypothetical protein [Oscillospiraceae bacterium]
MNSFSEKATKFLSVLDEVYKRQAITAILDDAALANQFAGTKTVKIPRITVDGAGDYDREAGYAQGAVAASFEEYELKYDRGRKFRIDVIDDDEAAFDLYRQVALQYLRTREIPEIDAVRFAEIYAAANKEGSLATVVEADLGDNFDPLALIDEAERTLNEKEVPDEGRVLFCTNDFYVALKSCDAMYARIDTGDTKGELDRRVLLLDGMTPIIRVPQARFITGITLLDGVSDSQLEGGYKAAAGAKGINFVYADKNALHGVIKRRFSKIIEPDANQQADAYDIFYRAHHDLIVKGNESAGIYLHAAKTALN